MVLLSCRGIKKYFGPLTVLKEVNMDIRNGDRIGLVGGNGAGKTTLANIIFASMDPDEGVVQCRKETKIGYLLQSTSFTIHTFDGLLDKAHHSDKMEDLFKVTSNLGLKKVQEWNSERLSGLSGGEKTKLALAHIWASKPDILILDEPTNHMDLQGVEWLVHELENYDGAALIISHDRYFLDQVVKQVIELEDGLVNSYSGNYTFYRDEKAHKYSSQLHQYEVQKKHEQKIEAEIERLENWSSKAHREAGKVGKMAEMRAGVKEFYRSKAKKMDKQVKSRIKRLKKIETEGVSKPKEEPKVSFDFHDAEKHGRRILEAVNIVKTYGTRVLFQDSSFYIQRGDRIGLIGANGCGKTTLLRMIIGKESTNQGEIWLSPSAKIAYLSQDVADLNGKQSSLDMIQGKGTHRSHHNRARSLLVNMGFDDAMLKKPIMQLSLGERTRLKIANLILTETDFLILDEPSNHLDLHCREQLEKTLVEYKGTLLIVSHDRYMLEKICDKLLVIEEGKIRKVESGFKEYKEKQDKQRSQVKQNESLENVEENLEDQRLMIENRMIYLLGKLGQLSPDDPDYASLDMEFKQLVKKKQQLNL